MRYIGSKQLLLDEIKSLLDDHVDGSEEIFLDLFAGTNIVGNFFKKFYTVWSNDILYFNYLNAKAIIENNGHLNFKQLANRGISDPLSYLENIQVDEKNIPHDAYYTKAYSPVGGAMYFTVFNALKIDRIRNQIESWKQEGALTELEYSYLLSCLISAIPYISNITGTYGAFLKHWDKRALKSLTIQPLDVIDNGCKNKAFNEDANELVKRVAADIVYIDTPYNNRQYASNYHVLENIARNNNPELKGKTKIFNWAFLKSEYSIKNKALNAFDNLISNINAKHIIVSYNTEGIISENDLVDMLKKYAINGQVNIKRIPYKKYQSKKQSKNMELEELLFYIQKKATPLKTTIRLSSKRHSNWSITKKKLIKSPLNYIGGKYKLLPQILPLFPDKINTFIDLFSGGCNVGINVNAKHHIFHDMNSLINEMFRYFSIQDTDILIEKIHHRINENHLSKTNEDAYKRFRNLYNQNPNPLDLYVLTSFSYNYQFRFNNNREYNNPFGRNRSQFSDNMEKNLRRFLKELKTKDAVFIDGYFTNFDISSFGSEDFFYLDPPYLITTGNYNDGNRGFLNWNEKQELELLNLMDKLTRKGIKYALSNVLEHRGKSNYLLKEYINRSNVNVHYLDMNYDNSSYNKKGKGSIEVLITNY